MGDSFNTIKLNRNTIKWNIYTSLVLSQSKQYITTKTVYHNNFFYFPEFLKINKKHCITIIFKIL